LIAAKNVCLLKHKPMRIFIALLLIANTILSCKQNSTNSTRTAANETEENIYRSADSMMAAFKRRDWVAFTKYNHPTMEKMMGGPQAFAAFIGEQMKQIPDTAIKSLEPGKILQVIKTDKDQQCVVEQNMEMHLNGTKISNTTYLVGESLDGGKSWTFFDASTGRSPKDIKADISPELKIPEKKQKVDKL